MRFDVWGLAGLVLLFAIFFSVAPHIRLCDAGPTGTACNEDGSTRPWTDEEWASYSERGAKVLPIVGAVFAASLVSAYLVGRPEPPSE